MVKMPKGNLRPEDEKQIRQNYKFIKTEIEALDLLDSLFQYEVITLEDKIRISNGKTKSERNEDLLRILLHSGAETSFKCFLLSLQEKYPHVRKRLEKTDGIIKEPVETGAENDALRKEIVKMEILVMEKKNENQQLTNNCENLHQQLRQVKEDGEKKDEIIENLRKKLAAAEQANSQSTRKNEATRTENSTPKPIYKFEYLRVECPECGRSNYVFELLLSTEIQGIFQCPLCTKAILY